MEWIVGFGLFTIALAIWFVDSSLNRIADALVSVSDQLAQEFEGDDPEAS